MAAGLTGLEEAQAAVLALARAGETVELPLAQARGWLAAPLVARRTQPWADLSAMDGYALGAGDGPWRVVRAIPAEAREAGALGASEAARIFTGAPLPTGADRILIQEDALLDGEWLTASELPVPGRWIRTMGSDFGEGDVLIDGGAAITPGLIALAASANHAALTCHRLANAHILATGSELVLPGSGNAGLPSSNNAMLSAMVAPFAGRVTDAGVVPDDVRAIGAAIRAFEDANVHPALLLLSGGASVGDHDLVRPVLEARGWSIALHKIAMKPGKPLIVAHKAGHVVLGLPGNPVSAFVTATLFALPVLRRMAGSPDPLPRHERGLLAAPLPRGSNRTEYLRGRRNADGSVEPIGRQDSAALLTLARADVLIRLDIDAPPQDIGAPVAFITIS